MPVSVLFLTHEPMTSSMAGPSIRVWELAHVLARTTKVTIGTPNHADISSPALELACYAGDAMAGLVESHEVVIAFGYLLSQYPVIARRARYLAVDIFDPFILENLHMHDDLGLADRLIVHQHDLDIVLEQLERADFLFCASERQRDYWLGALTAANRINPYTFAEDRSLRRLIDIVPFGLSSEPPRRSEAAIRGVTPGIGSSDVLVLWGGGVWNWFDPLTAIRAIGRIKDESPAVKLFFMGMRHPNPAMPQMAMTVEAFRLAEELGLKDRQVFLNPGWIPYGQRQNYLSEADIGISLAFNEIETQFSFRTRVLDYLWAGLPVVSTGGDTLTDAMAAAGAALTVAGGDDKALADILLELARDPARRKRMRAIAQGMSKAYTWDRVAAPLLAYCEHPYRSADAGMPGLVYPRIRLRGYRRALAIWRQEGTRSVVARASRRIARRIPGFSLARRISRDRGRRGRRP